MAAITRNGNERKETTKRLIEAALGMLLQINLKNCKVASAGGIQDASVKQQENTYLVGSGIEKHRFQLEKIWVEYRPLR